MKLQKIKAFTLVELIVVITILAVLGTIGFISLQGYSATSRDSVRISDLRVIEKGLTTYLLKESYYPETSSGSEAGTAITYSGSEIWTQGTYGQNTHALVGKLSNIPVDPLVGSEYAYSRLNTKMEYQLGAIMEGDLAGITSSANAAGNKYNAYVKGNYNGIMAEVVKGSTRYYLAVPSILSNDITLESSETTKKYSDILTNTGLVYKNYENIVASYDGELVDKGGEVVPMVNESNFKLLERDIDEPIYTFTAADLSSFGDNINKAYSGTSISSENKLSPAVNMNTDDDESKGKAAAEILNTHYNTDEIVYVDGATIVGLTNNGYYNNTYINDTNKFSVLPEGTTLRFNSDNSAYIINNNIDEQGTAYTLIPTYGGVDGQRVTFYVDNTAPTLLVTGKNATGGNIGLNNGDNSLGDVTIAFSDNNLDTATLSGAVNIDDIKSSSPYTVSTEYNHYKVTVADKAGNKSELSFSIDKSWYRFDPNCKNSNGDDIEDKEIDIGGGDIQVWAGCNSTLGSGIEYTDRGDGDSGKSAVFTCLDYEGNDESTYCVNSNLQSGITEYSYGYNFGRGDVTSDNIWGKMYKFNNLSPSCKLGNAGSDCPCPSGWHLPSVAEYEILLNKLGNSSNNAWDNHEIHNDSNNIVEFLEIPLAGQNIDNGGEERGEFGYLLTTTESNGLKFEYNNDSVSVGTNIPNTDYVSARCIKDTP